MARQLVPEIFNSLLQKIYNISMWLVVLSLQKLHFKSNVSQTNPAKIYIIVQHHR